MSATIAVAARQHFDYLARTVLRPCERFICRDRDFEDRRQEGLGRCWEWYSNEVARGRTPDTALVVHACRLAMVNRDRSLVGHEHRPRHDVYDRQGIDIELRRLDACRDRDDDDGPRDQDPAVGVARLGLQDPTDHVVSRIDLGTWLEGLADDDREAMRLRNAGFGLVAIGEATRRSPTTVFNRIRQLGEVLARRAGLEVPATASRGRRRRPSAVGVAGRRAPEEGR